MVLAKNGGRDHYHLWGDNVVGAGTAASPWTYARVGSGDDSSRAFTSSLDLVALRYDADVVTQCKP